jgi:hypothetical protein
MQQHLAGSVHAGENVPGHQLLAHAAPVLAVTKSNPLRMADGGLTPRLIREEDTIFLRGANGDAYVFTPYTLNGSHVDPALLESIIRQYNRSPSQ